MKQSKITKLKPNGFSKLWAFIGLFVVVILIIGVIIFLKPHSIEQKNTEKAKSYPTEIPKELILDLQQLNSTQATSQINGQQTITVNYSSPNRISRIADSYKNRLETAGWPATVSTEGDTTIITAKKDGQEASYTLKKLEDYKTEVTMVYKSSLK